VATRPTQPKRPSGRTVVLAFAAAIGAAVALIAVALLFRNGNSEPPTTTPAVDLPGIAQEGAVLGDKAAGVTLIEYADAQCPACRFYSENVFPTVVNEYVRPGKVATEYRGFPFIGPDSVKALRFILAAGLQNRLWQLQEALYRYQGGENDGWVTDDLIRERAEEIPGLNVDKLFADAESDAIVQEADSAADKAQAAGIPGTPTFFVKIGDDEPYFVEAGFDVEQMRAVLDDALDG
jgi:protein-disulfide isomerase